jgi:hypothetical protein
LQDDLFLFINLHVSLQTSQSLLLLLFLQHTEMKSKILIIFPLLISISLSGQVNPGNEDSKNELLKTIIQNSYPGKPHQFSSEWNDSIKGNIRQTQQFHSNMPVIIPGTNPYMKIKEPDSSVKYHIIIKDPYLANNSKSYHPLIIVNGEENKNGIKKINPKDIKNITIIKDKSVIEKYGEKGRNGILEITTK